MGQSGLGSDRRMTLSLSDSTAMIVLGQRSLHLGFGFCHALRTHTYIPAVCVAPKRDQLRPVLGTRLEPEVAAFTHGDGDAYDADDDDARYSEQL